MRPDTCYYDGQCGLCTRSTRVLMALDWLGTLQFQDMNAARDLPVPMETALRGMPMRTARGRVLIGFPAMRRALIRTPLGAILAWVLYVPGLSWLGRCSYDRFARRRRRSLMCRVTH